MSESELIEVEFDKIEARTDKAVLLTNFDKKGKNQWVPESVIDVLDPAGFVTLQEWFYNKC